MSDPREAGLSLPTQEAEQEFPIASFHGETKTFTHILVNDTLQLATLLTDDTAPESVVEALEVLSRERLTDFGKELLTFMQGKTIIDLGCGSEPTTVIPRALARHAQAHSYIGVDLWKTKKQSPNTQVDGFTEAFIEDDILEFLRNYSPDTPSLFLVSGIEPVYYPVNGIWPPPYHIDLARKMQRYKETLSYIDHSLREIARICEPSGGILIGYATKFWEPENYGFVKSAKAETQKLFIK